jgi:hypothetical protein
MTVLVFSVAAFGSQRGEREAVLLAIGEIAC